MRIERCRSAGDLAGSALASFRQLAGARGLARASVLIPVFASAFITVACRAGPPVAHKKGGALSAAAEVRSLRDFGAVGDGRTDDTAAVQRALSNSAQYCLEGRGRSYRIVGTLRVQGDLCLRNATLVQSLVPFDTRPYIRHSCPITLDASAVVDCGDPAIPPEQLSRLRQSLSVRTLLIRPDKPSKRIRVTLDHLKVDRGHYPEGGSRSDSAGIWLEGADRADLRNVEVTGMGKGYGLIVLRSSNVTVDNLWVHDLVWSPYAGDTPLTRKRISAIGWNSVPIHEFREAGEGGVRAAKFYGVRVQEQVTCAVFAEVQNVLIRNPKVSRCLARFQDGDLPWQADGLDIGASSSRVRVDGAVIESTWEGMDIVAGGAGISGLNLTNLRVSDSFGFGLKFGYVLRDVHIANVVIHNSGIAGIVLYGPVSGVSISNAQLSGVGAISVDGKTFVPWPQQTRSGILITDGPTIGGAAEATPNDVLLENIVIGKSAGVPSYDYGIFNKGGKDVRVRGSRAIGFGKAAARGISTPQ